MAWGNTTGGDHEGAAWTPANTTVIGGVHYNISTFTVTTGYTVHLEDDNKLEIYGDTITVTGDIDGNGHSNSGCGNGGAGVSDSAGAGGGGGGGYGAAGGAGGAGTHGAAGSAGSQCGTTDTTIIYLGSKGGNGGVNSSSSTPGGKGGGSVYLSGNTVTVTGTIYLNGLNGAGGSSGGGGGGGSGGGLLIVGGAVTFTGTYTGTGGNGGSTTNVEGDGGGGGGAGGRVKIIYRTINISGATWTLTAGTGGTSSHATNGVNGTIGNHTDTEVKCNSTYAMGQTFTPDTAITGKFYLSQVRLWVMSVATSGKVFTMTVYDDSAKGTNYGSTTHTISPVTGEKDFDFEPWIELPDAHDQYYFEVTTPDGDVDFGTAGNDPEPGEDMYFKVVLVERFSMYFRIFGLIPVDSPEVYNIADTTVKSEVANYMLAGAIHTIDTDGTGTFQYADDFTTAKYGQDTTTAGTVTYDSVSNEVDIAASSSIYWKCDTKHPPTGIPTLEARLNVTGGVPTVKIAADSGGSPDTWYDIDTAIVDDVLTAYDLDNATNLSIKKTGTPFYVKIDCPAGATVSVKSIQIDADIVTIDVEHPIISNDGVSTFRCDQNAGSGMSCTIELGYRARSWPA